MGPYYWNDWYAGWGWILWLGFVILLIASVGNWGYTYRTYRRYGEGYTGRDPIDILNERYAKGEITREEFSRMKAEIADNRPGTTKKVA